MFSFVKADPAEAGYSWLTSPVVISGDVSMFTFSHSGDGFVRCRVLFPDVETSTIKA